MTQNDFFLENGHSIHYSFRNGDEMILFLHGYLQSKIVWEPFLETIPKEIGFVAPDLPGHGSTSNYSDNFFTKYCSDLKALLESRSISVVHVVGYSMGGYVALHLLRCYPKMVKSVTLLHATPLADTAHRLKNRTRELAIIKMGKMNSILVTHFEQLFAPQNRERLSHYSDLFGKLARETTPQGMAESVVTMSNRGDYIDVCKNSALPIQIVFGLQDTLLSQERALECESVLPNIKYYYLIESGHTSFIEQPNEVWQIINNVILI